MQRISVIDSHTGGEPTRLIIEGGPHLVGNSLAEKAEHFRLHYDAIRSAVVNEPRGSDVMVGALLLPPCDPTCEFGVLFFNNVGYLGMCGHGTIGLVATLAHMGKISQGTIRIDTAVGPVSADYHGNGLVSLENVPSYRKIKDLAVEVPGVGNIKGDLAWGGNWFYLVKDHGSALTLANCDALVDLSWRIRQALNANGYPEVDHVELFGPPQSGGDSRNFVLCPGKAYDRSPCGTGTSAKLACLAADETLAEGATWVQESILGSQFTGSFRWLDRPAGTILPNIRGSAHVCAESTLLLNPEDPFCHGIRA
jgi:proline racemase